MNNIFETAKKKETSSRTDTRKRKSVVAISNVVATKIGEDGLSKSQRKKKNKIARRKAKITRNNHLLYLEEKRKRIIDSYNAKNLNIKDKQEVYIEEDIEIDGKSAEAILSISNKFENKHNGAESWIEERWCGYEDMYNVLVIKRLETNYEYRCRKKDEEAERRFEIEEEKERLIEERINIEKKMEKLKENENDLKKKLKELSNKLSTNEIKLKKYFN
jgi:hypothetical protein